ncbi:hypothetical protein C806_02176 [Lachnospiraceae bacterium 3-1]|nr:hypothetical protein C806_02176 [Lachnospiraceae bacterium 3-1]
MYFPVFALVIAEEPSERHRDLAVCEPLPHALCAVFRNAPALLLRQRGHDGNQQFSLGIECPDVFFFKITIRAVVLQPVDGGKAVHRKTAAGNTAVFNGLILLLHLPNFVL